MQSHQNFTIQNYTIGMLLPVLSFAIFHCALNYGAFAISSNYFCAEMSPQQRIIIDQLMGMWYGVEIMPHYPKEEHYVRVLPSCPIIHISEDKSFLNNYNNLYRGYDYGYNYGERSRDPNRNYDRNSDFNRGSTTRDYNNYNLKNPNRDRNFNQRQGHYQYGQDRSTYGTQTTKGYGTGSQNDWIRKFQDSDMKHLRILWDENGSSTEYRVRYNISEPGFWMSAGPQNGSELEPQYSHLAGNIQVIKAVGSHLVLTFCHLLPSQQLFTVILSREIKLDIVDIHGVHSQLNRKGLSTTSVKKVCNGGDRTGSTAIFSVIITIITLILGARNIS